MGECIRNTYDIIEYANSHNIAGLLLTIDFEKAFDSISHSFILKALHFFGFGYSFLKWINVLLNDASSCINHCGNITARFPVQRSCRQGDPISPYLFILCVEILALKIRSDQEIKGFRLGKLMKKIDFYADDLTAFLDGTRTSLERMVAVLRDFFQLSGLKINLSKCKAIWIGSKRREHKICEDFNLIWDTKFRLLGIDFDSDLAQMDTNFRKKVDEIKKVYDCWYYRHLSPIGRIAVIKSLALSKLTHVALVCPYVEKHILKELESMSYKFLWKNKPDRIKRDIATLPMNYGGLNMVQVDHFWDSLKLSWCRRLMTSNDVWTKILQLNLIYHNFELKDVWFGGPSLLARIRGKLTNIFWSETINAMVNSMDNLHHAYPEYFFHLNVFDNDLFAKEGGQLKRYEFPLLWSRGLCQVGDFFDVTIKPPKFLSRDVLNNKYSLRLNFLSYHRLKSSIEAARISLNITNYFELSDVALPRLPPIFKLASLREKGCSEFYKTLRVKKFISTSTEAIANKWSDTPGLAPLSGIWKRIWRILKNRFISNRLRWVQIQINHFILPTNYTVNKYKPTQTPWCSFCTSNGHLENLQSLLWDCPVVKHFWTLVAKFLVNFSPDFVMDKSKAVFGDTDSTPDSVVNTVLIWGRSFIWKEKFTQKKLSEACFLSHVNSEIGQLKEIVKSSKIPAELISAWVPVLRYFNIALNNSDFNDIMS